MGILHSSLPRKIPAAILLMLGARVAQNSVKRFLDNQERRATKGDVIETMPAYIAPGYIPPHKWIGLRAN